MEKLQNDLIKHLKEDARFTVAQLSAMTGATEEEVKKAIKQLETSGVIVKYTAIINTEKLQEERVKALIELKVSPQKLRGYDRIAEEINQFGEVKDLYLMSGGFDLMVLAEGRTLTELARFVSEKLATVEGVLSAATHFILKKYKIEGQTIIKSDDDKRQIIN